MTIRRTAAALFLGAVVLLSRDGAAAGGGIVSLQAQAAAVSFLRAQPETPAAARLRRDRVQRDRRVRRARPVAVDFAALREAARTGVPLEIHLFDDRRVVAARERVDTIGAGRYTWAGRLVEGGEGLVSIAINGDRISAQVWVGGEVFEIHAADEIHQVAELDPRQFPDERHSIGVPAALAGDLAGADTTPAAPTATAPSASPDSGAEVDLLVVYTPAARTKAGGTAAMLARIDLAVANANLAYQNSGVTFRLRLAHREEVSYSETRDSSGQLVPSGFNTDLGNLTGRTDGFMDRVHALRDAHGADFVALLIDNPSSCGIGWVMSPVSSVFEAWAFSVTEQSCAAGNLTLAHELGHNMGLQHDIANAGGAQPAFSYAYGYQDPGFFRTVMAYACSSTSCPRVPFFSTATRTYNSRPTGVANASENARALNNAASTIANFRQAVSSCSYSLAFTAANTTAGGGGGSVAVSAPAGCQWTASSNASFLAVTGGSPGSGSGTLSYNVMSNSGPPRSGTLTIAGQRFTVTQASSLPTLAASSAVLRFGGTVGTAGELTSSTPSQTVLLTQNGAGTVSWTATADRPWLKIASGAGTGSGRFVVTVAPDVSLLSASQHTAMITVSAVGAQASIAISVELRLATLATDAEAPIGAFDTPAANATGVVGSIGVTGWALDNVGVASVKIYRNCVGFEPAANCQPLAGVAGVSSAVFIGDASFLPGARPDVASVFPAYPNAGGAGWGYLMLTNMLPHLPGGRVSGGQGTFTIYAVATDFVGRRALLGGGGRTITLTNDAAAKPFGAIDTPGQGATVSGVVPNFGWTLTPGTAMIPTSGGTMFVFVDGVPLGSVTYNQCRGTAGNPAPVGKCNDDIAALFPGFTNITGGAGAIGSYLLDTTKLSNGPHSIAWSVTDDLGRVEGIGSRNFTVVNPGSNGAELSAPHDAAAPSTVPLGAPVFARTGFDLAAPWVKMSHGADGVHDVTMRELGRAELWIDGDVTAGHLVVNGALKPLPAGSRLSGRHFTWTPVAGFIGSYELVFGGAAGRVTVRVTIEPRAALGPAVGGYIDTPATGATPAPGFSIAGWVIDRDALAGSGVGAVHVWAFSMDGGPGTEATFLGAADLGFARPDVALAEGSRFEASGWQLATRPLPPGEYEVVAYVWLTRTGRFEDARRVRVTIR